MSKLPQTATCLLLVLVAGCQFSNPQKAALQGTVYYGHAIELDPKDTLYVTGKAYMARAEGVKFEETKEMLSHMGRTDAKLKSLGQKDQRWAERPKEWKREGGIRFPVGVGSIRETNIEANGRFEFTDLEAGAYLVWFDWKYGDVRSGDPQRHKGPRVAVSMPFRVNIEEGKVVQREFLLNLFLDILFA